MIQRSGPHHKLHCARCAHQLLQCSRLLLGEGQDGCGIGIRSQAAQQELLFVSHTCRHKGSMQKPPCRTASGEGAGRPHEHWCAALTVDVITLSAQCASRAPSSARGCAPSCLTCPRCAALCCCSKLHSMQLQLWCDTYDSKNVKALSLISQEQHKVEQELHEAIEQVRQ